MSFCPSIGQNHNTPLSVAAHNGHDTVIKILTAHKANVNTVDEVLMYCIFVLYIIITSYSTNLHTYIISN